MLYNSTQNAAEVVTSAQAISQGISKDGGLFVPQEFPKYDEATLQSLLKTDYRGRAKKVFSDFLTDFTEEEINDCVEKAYTAEKFDGENPAPLAFCNVDGKTLNILELWHGPTCAFKDMALQILPYLLTVSSKKNLKDKEIVILFATSGDTGKAALEGFKDVEGTKILVFYPNDGVSPMQKLQMTTQEGNNVGVCAIYGNFDDAQTGVKSIFTNKEILKRFEENDLVFSSANSINWGRLAPQIVYYVSAYCDMVNSGAVKFGDKINVVVPTGNFGNILAAYFAKEMGLPVNKLICASNANNVLTDFIENGVYDRNRDFYTTVSPSMDILISSNLERLLYILCGRNSDTINEWFGALKDCGKYTVSEDVKAKINELFAAGFGDDELTNATISETYSAYNSLADTHTAVAINVCNSYEEKTGDKTPVVIASTASPFKFSKAVLSAVDKENKEYDDEFATVAALEDISSLKAPEQLAALKGKEVRFNKVTSKEDMAQVVFDILGI